MPRHVRRIRLALPLLAILFLCANLAPPVAAQEQSQGAPSAESLRELVEAIENPQEREKLIKQLRALIDAREAGEEKAAAAAAARERTLLDKVSGRISKMGTEVQTAIGELPSIDEVAAWAERQVSDPAQRGKWIEALWKIALALLAGLLAEFILRWLLARPRARIEAHANDNLLVRLPYLLIRTILDVIPIAGFAGAAYTVLPLLEPSEAARAVALPLIVASLLSRAIMAAFRMILAPRAEGLRLLEIPTAAARYLYTWVARIVRTGVYGYFVLLILASLGLPAALFALMVKVLGLVVGLLVIVLIMQNRREVADRLRGEGPQPAQESGEGTAPAGEPRRHAGPVAMLRRRVADLWHVLAILFVLAAYIVWAGEIGDGFAYLATALGYSALAVFLGWLIHLSLQRALARALRIDPDFAAENPDMARKAERYLPLLRRGVTAIVAIVTILFVLQAWRVNIFGWLTTGSGTIFVGTVLTIFFLIAGAVVVWEAASTMIERYIARVEARQPEGTRASRLTTLLPLGRNAIMVALSLFVALTILSELGVNIAPLLAGAGVIGLAIGFGAQSLVKDVITGIFNLVEDTIAVGDIVSVGGNAGVVEAVSIRSVKLRAYSGDLYTVPFGDVTTVQNMTKDFSCYVFDIGVAYRENVDEVMAVLRELADEFESDPEWAPQILNPLEIPGLQAMDDSAVIVRARYKVVPGSQWTVGREFNRRIKAEFDRRGIEIPYPHMTLYFGEDKEGKAPPAFVQLIDGPKKPGPGRKRGGRVKKEEPQDDSGDPAVMPDEGN